LRRCSKLVRQDLLGQHQSDGFVPAFATPEALVSFLSKRVSVDFHWPYQHARWFASLALREREELKPGALDGNVLYRAAAADRCGKRSGLPAREAVLLQKGWTAVGSAGRLRTAERSRYNARTSAIACPQSTGTVRRPLDRRALASSVRLKRQEKSDRMNP
jgi:hypothetical protein